MKNQIRMEQIQDMRFQQEIYKNELLEAKDLLEIDRSTWNFDCKYQTSLPSFLLPTELTIFFLANLQYTWPTISPQNFRVLWRRSRKKLRYFENE